MQVKDGDFGYNHVVVRDGEGQRDRVTMLPLNVKASLQCHVQAVEKLHIQDLEEWFGCVYLPYTLPT